MMESTAPTLPTTGSTAQSLEPTTPNIVSASPGDAAELATLGKRVTIVIITYRREEMLQATLLEVAKLPTVPCQLIVVDQGPEHDPTAKLAPVVARGVACEYIFSKFASITAARNIGLSRAVGAVVLYIDDDVRLDSDVVDEHARYYQEEPGLAGVAGHITCNPRGSERFVRWNTFRPAGDYVLAGKGCHMSFDAQLLRQLGGFNSFLTKIYDESELFFRLNKLGYKVRNGSRAILCHLVAEKGGVRTDAFESHNHFRNLVRDGLVRTCSCYSMFLALFWPLKNWRSLWGIVRTADSTLAGWRTLLHEIILGLRLGWRARQTRNYIAASIRLGQGLDIDPNTRTPLLSQA